MKILVLNGPNINFLGIREKGIYGNQDYDTLVKMIEEKAQELGVEVEVFQSNYEGGLIDRIQKAYFEKADDAKTLMFFHIPLQEYQTAWLVRLYSGYPDAYLLNPVHP